MTGNLFFAVRAACELAVGMSLYLYYKRELLPFAAIAHWQRRGGAFHSPCYAIAQVEDVPRPRFRA